MPVQALATDKAKPKGLYEPTKESKMQLQFKEG